jgi:D-aspartate ligase
MRRSGRETGSLGAGIGGVVLGGDYQGLGIARSLGRHGIPVVVVDDEPSIARFSRYASLSLRVDDLHDHQKAVASLLEIGCRHKLQGWVLFPTRDELVAAISRSRVELAKLFRVPTPGWEGVRAAWDKRQTYALAERLAIAHPRTVHAGAFEELPKADIALPAALKPAIKEHFIYATHLKALRADSREELETLYRRACTVIPADEVMLQELIPGDGECQFSYCALVKGGKPLAKMVAQRKRQHPPDFGRASTYVETLDLPELEAPSERFLAAINYDGLAEVEYKLDPRDRRFKLLDVNLRTWGYHTLGASAGVDFPWLLFRDQMGETLEPSRALPGIRWIRLATDLPTSLGEVLRGRLSAGAFLKSVVSFDTEAVFAVDDPLPGLAEIAHLPYLLRTRGGDHWGENGGKAGEG